MKKNNLMPIEPGNIIYFCPTKDLDKMVMEAKGLEFDEDVANQLEAGGLRFCFVVSFDGDYTIVPAKALEFAGIYGSGEKTTLVEQAMDHYIQSLA